MSTAPDPLHEENQRLRAQVEDLELALNEAERNRFFETIIENLYDGVSVVDREGVIRYESPSVERITGRPTEEVRGRTFIDYLHPDEVERVVGLMQDHLQAPREWREAVVQFRHADGSYRTLESRAINLVDDDSIEGFVAIYRDVTEQHRLLQRFEEADHRLREISASLPGVIFQMRAPRDFHHFEVVYVSEGIEGVTGVDAETARANPWLMFDTVHPEDKPRFFESMREAAASATGFAFDFRVGNDDSCWMRTSAACRELDDDHLLFTGVSIDVTAERETRKKLQKSWLDMDVRVQEATRELRQKNRELQQEIERREIAQTECSRIEDKLDAYERIMTTGEMMTGVAHDLHQPLTAIANYAGGCLLRIERGTLGEADLVGIFNEIRDSALHAAAIVRHMLDFTKNRRLQRHSHEIRDVCEMALRLCRVGLRESRVELETEYDENLPNVLADEIAVAQVVQNLVANAAHALETRGDDDRRVRLRTTPDEIEGFVRTSVIDNGPGLPRHQHETIFDRFVTSKSEGLGLGLGLAMCKTIVEMHEGRIWVETPAEGGCAFHFTLPLAPPRHATFG